MKRKVLSILMVGLLMGMAVSCRKNEWEYKWKKKGENGREFKMDVPKFLDRLSRKELTAETLTAKLVQKGLTVRKAENIESLEYLLGLCKLNRLEEKEIKQAGQFLNDIAVVINDRFEEEVSTELEGRLSIDCLASVTEIKKFVLRYDHFAYDAYLGESLAYKNSKKIIDLLSSKGINILGKTDSINWRKCLDGLVKLSLISEVIPGNKIGKDKVKIRIGTIWHKRYIGGEIERQIDYEASLEEIYSYILLYL